jgi:predicted MFS family arabinose efflux permease
MFGTTGLAGLAIGPVIAEVIIKGFGFSTFFLAASGLGAVGLLLQLLLPESYINASHESSQSFFSVLLKDSRMITVALLALLFGFGLAAAGSFVSPLAKERNLAFVSLYFVSYSFAAVLTRVLGGRFADKVGEERVVPHALILVGAGLLALIFTRGTEVLVLSGLMSGCGHGFLFPCLISLAIRNEPISIRGKITGVFTGGIDAGAFVGSATLGYIGEWAGFSWLFLVAGLAVLSGLGVFRLHIIRNR